MRFLVRGWGTPGVSTPGAWRAAFHAIEESAAIIEIHPGLQMSLRRHPAELVGLSGSLFQKRLSQNVLDHLVWSSTCVPGPALDCLDEVVVEGKGGRLHGRSLLHAGVGRRSDEPRVILGRTRRALSLGACVGRRAGPKVRDCSAQGNALGLGYRPMTDCGLKGRATYMGQEGPGWLSHPVGARGPAQPSRPRAMPWAE
jgi:hypothetical protein